MKVEKRGHFVGHKKIRKKDTHRVQSKKRHLGLTKEKSQNHVIQKKIGKNKKGKSWD